MKKFQVSIQISVEMEDDTNDLGGVINSLSYIPSMVGATARLTGINVYEDVFAGNAPLAEGAAIAATSAASLDPPTPADEAPEERSGE